MFDGFLLRLNDTELAVAELFVFILSLTAV